MNPPRSEGFVRMPDAEFERHHTVRNASTSILSTRRLERALLVLWFTCWRLDYQKRRLALNRSDRDPPYRLRFLRWLRLAALQV